MDVDAPSTNGGGGMVDESPSAAYSKCPVCNTTKIMMPNLKLMFSTCCGRCMCVHCIDGRFKHHKQINCDVCSEPLKKTSWSPLPIEEQRFQSEVANRQEANRILTLEEIDFPTTLAYNDYLETCSDIIYLLTYGSKSDQALARTRLSEFQKTNRQAIDKSKSRKFQEKAEQERRERMGVVGGGGAGGVSALSLNPSANTMGSMINVPSFTLPQADDSVPADNAFKEEQRILAIRDVKAREAALSSLRDKRAQASGFRRETDWKRSKQEAMLGLLGWDWPVERESQVKKKATGAGAAGATALARKGTQFSR